MLQSSSVSLSPIAVSGFSGTKSGVSVTDPPENRNTSVGSDCVCISALRVFLKGLTTRPSVLLGINESVGSIFISVSESGFAWSSSSERLSGWARFLADEEQGDW